MPDERPQPADDHQPDGLDLARSMVLGAAGATARPASKSPRRTGKSSPRARTDDKAGTSGAHPSDRDPQPLGSEVDRLVGERGWELDLRVSSVFARWADIVGAEIGAHSTPESLTDGTLVVRADSTAWATQLKLLAPGVVKRLNAELGDGTVTVVEVRGPNAPTWKHGRLGVRDGRGPRDTYG